MGNELLIAAADNIAEYCKQTMECDKCKVQRICDALSDWYDEPLALAEWIRGAAEGQEGEAE